VSSSFPTDLRPYMPIPLGWVIISLGLMMLLLLGAAGLLAIHVSDTLEFVTGASSEYGTALAAAGGLQLGLSVIVIFFCVVCLFTPTGMNFWPFSWLRKWKDRHQYHLLFSTSSQGQRMVELWRNDNISQPPLLHRHVYVEVESARTPQTEPEFELKIPLGGLFRRITLNKNRNQFQGWKFKIARWNTHVVDTTIIATDPAGNHFIKTINELFDLFTLVLKGRPSNQRNEIITWREILLHQDIQIKNLETDLGAEQESWKKLNDKYCAAEEGLVASRQDQKFWEETYQFLVYDILDEIKETTRLQYSLEGSRLWMMVTNKVIPDLQRLVRSQDSKTGPVRGTPLLEACELQLKTANNRYKKYLARAEANKKRKNKQDKKKPA
jgi:hypothetical protein